MKVIRKDKFLDDSSLQGLKLEKDILYMVDHPFIVSMDFVFQNDFRIYFIMEFVEGGELYFHLRRLKRFDED